MIATTFQVLLEYCCEFARIFCRLPGHCYVVTRVLTVKCLKQLLGH